MDLQETFNYLLGLRVQHMAAPEVFTATFERVKDEEVAKDQAMRSGRKRPPEARYRWPLVVPQSARLDAATATSPTASAKRC